MFRTTVVCVVMLDVICLRVVTAFNVGFGDFCCGFTSSYDNFHLEICFIFEARVIHF